MRTKTNEIMPYLGYMSPQEYGGSLVVLPLDLLVCGGGGILRH